MRYYFIIQQRNGRGTKNLQRFIVNCFRVYSIEDSDYCVELRHSRAENKKKWSCE